MAVRAHNPIIIGLAAATYGVILLAADPGSFQSPTFDLQFDVLPRPVWGVLFVGAGVLAATVRRAWTAVALVAVLGTWTVGLLRGVITGVATGPGGWVWPTALIVALIASYVRFGVDDR